MVLLEFYQNKHVFITGTTGFLGKVILERLMETLPEIAKIYVLIRTKKGSSVVERFKKEITESPCFDKIRQQKPNFDDYVDKLIQPIAGDLLKDNLDLSISDQLLLTSSVNIVIHSAASIDFNSRLDEAINMNILGTLKVYELASKMKNLESFIHISTCYVNCEIKGWVEEKIFEKEQDPEGYMQDLLRIPVQDIERLTPSIIGKYPNTYTFTKSLTERILKSRNKKTPIPLSIVRPSIIGCSYRDPTPGWVDTVSAGGALILFSGLGIIRFLPGNLDKIADHIPVDFVADFIIVAASFTAQKNKSLGSLKEIDVYHCSSTAKNPANFRVVTYSVHDYFTRHPPSKRMGKPDCKFISNKTIYELQRFKRRIPAYLFYRFAQAIGNKKIKMQANKLNKMLNRADALTETFSFFTTNEWTFQTEKVNALINYLTPHEREIFQLDITTVDWKTFFYLFNYGLQKYVLKENVEPPGTPENMDLFSKHYYFGHFSDIKWALENGKAFNARSSKSHTEMILNSSKIKDLIQKMALEKINNSNDPILLQKSYKEIERQAASHCKHIFAEYNFKLIKTFGWFLHKLFKQIYEKVVIDETAIARLKFLEEDKTNGPIILIPTHRSYIDFLIVSYIFFAYKLKCPHIAAAEDFLSITLVHKLLRSSGAFFIKRKQFDQDPLYRALMNEYIQRLLLDDCFLEFFVEGTRSRSGKMLPPKFGMLSVATDLFFEKRVNDLQILPITINYERVLEGETFPFELLGEEKVKESLMRIVKGIKIMNMNFGRIYVEIGDPISVQKYEEGFSKKKQLPSNLNVGTLSLAGHSDFNNPEYRKRINTALGYEIIYQMNEKLVVMPTAIVAAIILTQRNGISEDILVEKVEWLRRQLILRGAKIGSMNESSPSIAVRNAINHLEQAVIKTKKDIFELSVSPKVDYKNILLLSYYRNTLTHMFVMESFVVCAISAFGHQLAWKEGVSIERLWEETNFLMKLCEKEFIVKDLCQTIEELKELLEKMAERGIFEIEDKKVKVKKNSGDEMVSFLNSLIWPLVDTYWVAVVFLFSMKQKQPIAVSKFIIQIQWFAESLYEERVLEHYESCSQDTIKNAVSILKSWEMITVIKDVDPKTKEKREVVKLLVTEERLRNLEDHIKKFQKYNFAKSMSDPIENARKSLLINYPFMAKI